MMNKKENILLTKQIPNQKQKDQLKLILEIYFL